MKRQRMCDVMQVPMAVLNQAARMSLIARAGFLLLLAEQWESEDGYLPADDEALCAISALSREEYGSAQAQMHARLVMVEGKCCEPQMRSLWEAEKELRGQRAQGARTVNLKRWGNGERLTGSAKRCRVAAKPSVSGGTTKNVHEVLRDRSKSSVMREAEAAGETGEPKAESILEIVQQRTRVEESDEEQAQSHGEPMTFRSAARLPLNLLSAPCHGNRDGIEGLGGSSTASNGVPLSEQPITPAGVQGALDLMKRSLGVARQVPGSKFSLVVEPTTYEQLAISPVGFQPRSLDSVLPGIEGEKQGATVPPDVQQPVLEAATAAISPETSQNDEFAVNVRDSDEIETLRAIAEYPPIRRAYHRPAPRRMV